MYHNTFTPSSNLLQHIALIEPDSNTETGRLFVQDNALQFVGNLVTAPACFFNMLLPLINDYLNRSIAYANGIIPTLHSDSGIAKQSLNLLWRFDAGLYGYSTDTNCWSVMPNNNIQTGYRLPTGDGLGDDYDFNVAYVTGQQFYLESSNVAFSQGLYAYDEVSAAWTLEAIEFGPTFPVSPSDGQQFYLNKFSNVVMGSITVDPAPQYSGEVSANTLLLFNATAPLVEAYVNNKTRL